MVPSYDFDILWLIPREADADPEICELLNSIGCNSNSSGNFIALFRDPEVVAMIERADPQLREFLKDSGFGFVPYQNGAPAGHYPAEDADARADTITRLGARLAQFDLKDADLGGFDFGAFLKSIAEAKPLPANADDPAPDTSPMASGVLSELDTEAVPSGYAKLTGRNRVLPLMALSLAVTLGVYWAIQHIKAAPGLF